MVKLFVGNFKKTALFNVSKKKKKAADCIYLDEDRICRCKKSPQYTEKCFVASSCTYKIKEKNKTSNNKQNINKPVQSKAPTIATKYSSAIGIGSIVTVLLDDEEETYKIVSKKMGEANEILFDCDLAKALLNRKVGDFVTVKTKLSPREYTYEIIKVDNTWERTNKDIQGTNVNKSNQETLSAFPIVQQKAITSTPKGKFHRNIFFCFQGKQFVHEVQGGYIFAGLDPSISHWARLKHVKEGDIIFHGGMQGILAISIVQGDCFIAKRPEEHYLANDKKDAEGLMVKTKYRLLKNPLIILEYRQEIIKLQGDHHGKGYPFNKNGKGNQGYLFNLNKNLAKFFVEEIVKINPSIITEDYVKELLL